MLEAVQHAALEALAARAREYVDAARAPATRLPQRLGQVHRLG